MDSYNKATLYKTDLHILNSTERNESCLKIEKELYT